MCTTQTLNSKRVSEYVELRGIQYEQEVRTRRDEDRLQAKALFVQLRLGVPGAVSFPAQGSKMKKENGDIRSGGR